MSSKAVTIIVPVYGDWPSLGECIKSLQKNVDTTKDRVLLVNDCGPEVDAIERNILKLIDGKDGFEYARNKKNLGFIGTCNRAVNELDTSGNDVLLLNSDTKVTPGFLDEMRGVLYAEKNIGTVSPRSNNATICTMPLSAIRQKGIEAEKSYALFEKHSSKFPRFSKVPTAHGFCVLIRRSLIEKHGLFDTVFGKGYGEEVDFCQRIGAEGWNSVIAHHVFVFHLEARSFSLETKAKLLETNNQIIRQRYPNYKQSVQDYIDQALEAERKIFGEPRRKNISRVTTATKKVLKRSRVLRKAARKLRKS